MKHVYCQVDQNDFKDVLETLGTFYFLIKINLATTLSRNIVLQLRLKTFVHEEAEEHFGTSVNLSICLVYHELIVVYKLSLVLRISIRISSYMLHICSLLMPFANRTLETQLIAYCYINCSIYLFSSFCHLISISWGTARASARSNN